MSPVRQYNQTVKIIELNLNWVPIRQSENWFDLFPQLKLDDNHAKAPFLMNARNVEIFQLHNNKKQFAEKTGTVKELNKWLTIMENLEKSWI